MPHFIPAPSCHTSLTHTSFRNKALASGCVQAPCTHTGVSWPLSETCVTECLLPPTEPRTTSQGKAGNSQLTTKDRLRLQQAFTEAVGRRQQTAPCCLSQTPSSTPNKGTSQGHTWRSEGNATLQRQNTSAETWLGFVPKSIEEGTKLNSASSDLLCCSSPP